MEKKVKLNRIKEVLARVDKTQTQLAEEIGKSRVVVSNYCNNNAQPSLEILAKIAEVLEVPGKDLIDF